MITAERRNELYEQAQRSGRCFDDEYGRLIEAEEARGGDAARWYVAAMNDCIFIVNEPPRPAPVDYVNPNAPAPSVVISMRSGSRDAQEIAEQIVAAHNATL